MSHIRPKYFNVSLLTGVFLAMVGLVIAWHVAPSTVDAQYAGTVGGTSTDYGGYYVPQTTENQYASYANNPYAPESTFANPNAINGRQQIVGLSAVPPSYPSNGMNDGTQNATQNAMQNGMQPVPEMPPQGVVPPGYVPPGYAAPNINAYGGVQAPPQGIGQAVPGQMTQHQSSQPVMGAGDASYLAAANPMSPQPAHAPTMEIPAFGGTQAGMTQADAPSQSGNFEIPTFRPSDFSAPPQMPSGAGPGGSETPLLAFGGPIGNAYSPSGLPGGAVPAFQSPGAQETLANQGLNIRQRERPDDRRIADQKYIDTWTEIRNTKNTDAWRLQMPPYAGPLENRTIGKNEEESIVLQASFLTQPVKQDDYEYDWEREGTHLFNFSLLDPSRVGDQVKRWVGLGQDEEKARKYMEEALQLMKQEKYLKAAEKFEWAAYFWPETAIEEDARYHAAECYYREKRYKDATNQYTKLLSNFQSSPYKNEAINNLFEIAKIWIRQVTEEKAGFVNLNDKSRPTFDTFGHAEKALKTIFINCPSDPAADDCVYALAVAYMRRGTVQGDASYEHAAEYFKQLRDCYPNSEHVVEAMRWEAICRQKASLGADYSTRHIDEASKITEQLQTQYGTHLEPEKRNEIVQLRNQLTTEKALDLWEVGQFYDNRKDYGAARLQYRKLIDEYPATDYADRARKRIEEIRDFPDELPSDVERIKSFFRIGGK